MSTTDILDPGVKAAFSSAWGSVKTTGAGAAQFVAGRGLPLVLFGVAVIIVLGVGYWIIQSKRPTYETAANIRATTQKSVKAQNQYAKAALKRKGLLDYIAQEQKKGLTPSELALTNFYVSTVNATGFFFPATDGVFSPEAARIAVLAGARAFVFDIWPDLTPGAQFGPILQVVQEGSKWRRISLNSLQFNLVLKALIEEAFEVSGRPGSGDPVYLYLRFRGRPRTETLNGAAAALRTIVQPYRLPFVYNNRGRQLELYSDPIGNFFKKVIICSNVTGENTNLQDFINVGPKEGFKVEWAPNDAKGLTVDGKAAEIRKIKTALTWVAPDLNSPVAENNQYDQQANWDLGIHFCAMNFWADNDKTREYMKPEKFGTYSFLLKPEHLRHKIELLPNSKVPQDPGWGKGQTAGTPVVPNEIQLPN